MYVGNDYSSGQQLLETLWAYEEWKQEKRIDFDADFVARAEALVRQPSDMTNSSASPENSSSSASSSNAEESCTCVVCRACSRSVVLIPCGHLALCHSCYERLEQCPICRAVIRGAIRLHALSGNT